MKRYGNLWNQIVDWSNLLLAARYAQKRCDPALCGAVSFRAAKDARERAPRQVNGFVITYWLLTII